jgi:AcrR family transcriptional regulator
MPRHPARTAPRKAGYHHGDLRNALLAAALVLLRQHGPNAVSLREVAKQAGVSHAAPYRHFEDKHALLAAIAHEGFRRLGEAMAAAERSAADPHQQLIEAGRAYVELAVASPEITQLMFGGYLDPQRCRDELRDEADKAFAGLLKIIENGKAAAMLKKRDSQELALAAWSLAHGFAMLVAGGQLASVAADRKAIDALSRALGRLLLDGLAAPATPALPGPRRAVRASRRRASR